MSAGGEAHTGEGTYGDGTLHVQREAVDQRHQDDMAVVIHWHRRGKPVLVQSLSHTHIIYKDIYTHILFIVYTQNTHAHVYTISAHTIPYMYTHTQNKHAQYT